MRSISFGRREGTACAAAAAVILLLVLAAYAQVRDFDFAPLDDETYVLDNPIVRQGLTGEGIAWAFGTVRASNWHPMTWLSHMLDCEWYGLDAGGHHLTSVALHAANGLLLLFLLWRGTGALWPSVAAAALFALHPLRAESVAWIAERKDVLSGFFALLTLAAYGLYARRPSLPRYLAVVLAFALGLMSKPMLVTLPFVMLLLDFWPLDRFHAGPGGRRPSALLREKLPLFALAALSAAVTLSGQWRAGSVAPLDALPLGARIANAAVVPLLYLWKTIWPSGLACFYPYPAWLEGDGPALLRAAAPSAIALGVATALVLRFGLRRRYLPVGWLSYLGMLVPVIGFVQVGHQSMADRYTYLPMIGVSIAVCFGLRDLAAAFPPLRRALPVAGLAAALALTIATHRQVSFWRDGRALLEHAIAATESNFLAHNNLGIVLHGRGLEDQAEAHYRAAIEIRASYPEAQNNLGTVLQARGLEQEAEAHYRAAIEIDPGYPEAHSNLGSLLESRGDFDGAEREYRIALERRPRFAPALTNMGNVSARRGDFLSAVAWYEKALASDAAHAEAHGNLGFALARLARDADAEPHLRRALEIRPDLVETEATLALCLTRMGRTAEAIPHYRSVLARRPDRPELANNLAWILATRDGSPAEAEEAVRLAEQAAGATQHARSPVLMTLAAAYARAGRFEEAVRWQERAIELSEPGRQEGLRKVLERYRTGEALSEQ